MARALVRKGRRWRYLVRTGLSVYTLRAVYRIIRPWLFRLDPETAHALTLSAVRWAGALPPVRRMLEAWFAAPACPVRAFGLTFRNPVGLAAGYDKDALAVRGLAALGFGHVEVGTVTPRPQAGNPRPRLFRLVEDAAVINRMGFPSQGAERLAARLRSLRRRGRLPVVVGVNLGKNKDTPLEEAARDYLALLRLFAPLADYLVLNISSPNTLGLRQLQGRQMLEELLREVQAFRMTLPASPPMLVKLAPDLSEAELNDALAALVTFGMDGVVLTNTTLERAELKSRLQGESGGLSGQPLQARSEAVLRRAVQILEGRLPIISVGGIMTPEDAVRRLEMGATLVQVYTGLVYAGPGLVRRIVAECRRSL